MRFFYNMKQLIFIIYLIVSIRFSIAAQEVHIKFLQANHELFIPISLTAAPKEKLYMMFDSGAGTMLLDSALAARLGLHMNSENAVTGAGDSKRMRTASGIPVGIGGVKLENVDAVITDLSRSSAIMGVHMDGIIGYDILKRYPVLLDMDKQEIVIYQSSPPLPSKPWVRLPFNFYPEIPFLPQVRASFTTTDGKVFPGNYLLDTGAGLTALLNRPYVRDQNLEQLPGKRLLIRTEGLTGFSDRTVVRINSFDFSGFHFSPLPLQFARTPGGISNMTGISGLLGNEFLYRFNLLFDYPQNSIYVMPNHRYQEPIEFPVCGFQLKAEGKRIVVAHLVPGSEEEKAGMRENDEVLTIDDRSGLSLLDARKLLNRQGKTVFLLLRQHENEKKITIRLMSRV